MTAYLDKLDSSIIRLEDSSGENYYVEVVDGYFFDALHPDIEGGTGPSAVASIFVHLKDWTQANYGISAMVDFTRGFVAFRGSASEGEDKRLLLLADPHNIVWCFVFSILESRSRSVLNYVVVKLSRRAGLRLRFGCSEEGFAVVASADAPNRFGGRFGATE